MPHIAICQNSLPHYRLPVFDRLARAPGIELTLLVGDGAERATGRAFACETTPVRWGRGVYIHPAHFHAARDDRYDLVIMPWDLRAVSVLPATLMARRRGARTVLWGHGYSQNETPAKLRTRNGLGRIAHAVMLYSHTIADGLIDAGFDASRVLVAQNAIDQTPIEAARACALADSASLARFHATQPISPGTTAVFVSRLFENNRVDLAIRGLARVRETRPDARLVLIGDGPARGDLERLARQLGVAVAVVFTGAIYDENALAPWMLGAGLFVYPSNVGLSILHAFGYGLPALAGDRREAHNPEFEALVPGETGLVFRHDDVDDLARQWRHLLDDAETRRRLGDGAVAAVRERYTIDQMVRGFLDAAAMVPPPEPR